ncbi:UNKNOWN [Stylonychia lemnae]|uniref:Uncharacterized protein n=1 Tax=Stylonychia lemnae TaxID=5949 RepID=A0A078ASP7_STYLE|nr:UNKNOWN [Stylonychia lemnae]|eukprot:CDW85510.1 UNKNOWN [Stylonychia lemnae]
MINKTSRVLQNLLHHLLILINQVRPLEQKYQTISSLGNEESVKEDPHFGQLLRNLYKIWMDFQVFHEQKDQIRQLFFQYAMIVTKKYISLKNDLSKNMQSDNRVADRTCITVINVDSSAIKIDRDETFRMNTQPNVLSGNINENESFMFFNEQNNIAEEEYVQPLVVLTHKVFRKEFQRQSSLRKMKQEPKAAAKKNLFRFDSTPDTNDNVDDVQSKMIKFFDSKVHNLFQEYIQENKKQEFEQEIKRKKTMLSYNNAKDEDQEQMRKSLEGNQLEELMHLKSNDLHRQNTRKNGKKPPPAHNLARIAKLKHDLKSKQQQLVLQRNQEKEELKRELSIKRQIYSESNSDTLSVSVKGISRYKIAYH